MLLDLPAGDYRLLAWCGLKNDGEYKESFSVPEVSIGKTRIEQLQCALNRKRDEFGAYSKERLYRLFMAHWMYRYLPTVTGVVTRIPCI